MMPDLQLPIVTKATNVKHHMQNNTINLPNVKEWWRTMTIVLCNLTVQNSDDMRKEALVFIYKSYGEKKRRRTVFRIVERSFVYLHSLNLKNKANCLMVSIWSLRKYSISIENLKN